MNQLNMAAALEVMQHTTIPLSERLVWYADTVGLQFCQETPPGLKLKIETFDKILAKAITLLDEKDQRSLDEIAIIFSDKREVDWVGHKKVNVKWAIATILPTGNFIITLYRTNILQGQKLSFDGYVDWVRRLLLHEIGHVRDGRSDKEMAATDNY